MNTISLKQMRYALAVEQHKHFGRAAKANFVTQPALSQQITLLEDLLGMPIFERMGKTVLPTPQGKLFLEETRRIVGLSKELEEKFTHNKEHLPVRISLALIPTIAPYLLPNLLPALSNHFPLVQFSVSEQTTDQLVKAIKSGTCDVGVLATQTADDRLRSQALFDDPFVLATSTQEKLSEPVELAHLANENILLLADGHCLRDQTIDACQLQDAMKQSSFAATSLSTIVELVANNLGVTLLPAISIKREALGGRIQTLSLSSPNAGRTVSIIWRKSSPLQGFFQQIADIASTVGKRLLIQDVKQHRVPAAKL